MRETPKDAARRLAEKAIKQGFQPEALHAYRDASGEPVFWRIRLKHPNGEKWIRPMKRDGDSFAIGEPEPGADGKLIYRLPELLAVDRDAPVWIVEGEWATDHLARLGVTVTTTGSSSSAEAADLSPLAGRNIVLWPDKDAAGAKYADELRARLAAIGCAVAQVDVDQLDLPDKGDAVDWLAAVPGRAAADLDALPLLEDSGKVSGSAAPSAPEPLRRPLPDPEPYPVDELGEILRPATESLRRVIQAPDAVCGASVLAAASLATHALANVELDGRTCPISLWFLTVAESGGRKSAVDRGALKAARAFEKELTQAHDIELQAHAALMEEWEARRAAAKAKAKKSGGVGLADELRAIGPQPPDPLLPRVLVSDFTAEGLEKLLAAGRPALGAFADEGGVVFGGHGMSKEAITRTTTKLSKLWDGDALDRVRAMDGATKLYGRRLAMHLMAQPVIAERALSDEILAGQGFLARCLLAWPQSTAGTRDYREESLNDDPAMGRLAHRLGELHRLPLPLADGDRQELKPRALTLTAAAKAKWIELYQAIEGEQKPGGQFAVDAVMPYASKAAEQALRIAGVLTLLESPNAQTIEADTIARAAELALWHLNEARRLAGTSMLSPEVRDAEALLAWCHETGRRLLYSTDALQRGPARIRERKSFLRAMEELERAGWADPVEGGAEVDGGHRRHVWQINKGAV